MNYLDRKIFPLGEFSNLELSLTCQVSNGREEGTFLGRRKLPWS